MKRQNIIILICLLILFVACAEKDDGFFYDEKYLSRVIPDYDPNANFNNIFPQYKDYYNLTGEELKVVGMWNWYDPEINTTGATVWNFIFYPNNYAIIKYLGNDSIFGIWFINNEWLKIKIYSYKQVRKNKDGNNHIYQSVKPYIVKAIKLDDIDTNGFTRKRFEIIKLLKEIDKYRDNSKYKQIRLHRHRSFYHLNIGIDNPDPPEKYYSYFYHIPEMVERNLTGEDIVNNVELIKKFLNF